jgi:hypothetical protein
VVFEKPSSVGAEEGEKPHRQGTASILLQPASFLKEITSGRLACSFRDIPRFFFMLPPIHFSAV